MSSFNDSSELLDDHTDYCTPVVETVDNDMFTFQERPEKKPPREYKALDDCIDHAYESECHSIEKLIRSRRMPKRPKSQHLKPVTIVRFKNRLGKGKSNEILTLLDI